MLLNLRWQTKWNVNLARVCLALSDAQTNTIQWKDNWEKMEAKKNICFPNYSHSNDKLMEVINFKK